MTLLVVDNGSWVLLAAGCGDLQGDQAAPDKFLQLFDPRVDRWVASTADAAEKEFFLVMDPITGTTVDTSYGTYADDLARFGLCSSLTAPAMRSSSP